MGASKGGVGVVCVMHGRLSQTAQQRQVDRRAHTILHSIITGSYPYGKGDLQDRGTGVGERIDGFEIEYLEL